MYAIASQPCAGLSAVSEGIGLVFTHTPVLMCRSPSGGGVFQGYGVQVIYGADDPPLCDFSEFCEYFDEFIFCKW